jgi:2'-5' RNA ligase
MPTNHSYFIAINLPEPLNSRIEKIKKHISEEYGTRSVLKSPPHITIVPPFFWGNETELIGLVKAFNYPPFNIELNGYQAFQASVVYIDVEENEHITQLHQTFNAHFFGRYPQLKKKYPFPFQPHITVGNRDWKWDEFKRCWDDMRDLPFEASFMFTHLSLLKNVEGLWMVIA